MSKILILQSFKITNSQSKTARKLGISRQRVHQVVRGYKNYGTSGREKKYKLAWKDICEICKTGETIDLHHKDFNNHNDNAINLLSVCKQCHHKLHISKKWSKNFNKCTSCGVSDKDTHKTSHAGKGLCRRCWQSNYRFMTRVR